MKFSKCTIGWSPLRTLQTYLSEILKTRTPVLKRSAFLLLLIIIAYYVRRDLPAVISHPDLVKGLAIFSLVALSGLLLALSLQVHKEKEKIKRKLGENTYNWLTEED